MNDFFAIAIASIFIGMAAFIYAVILQFPGEVLGWLPKLSSRLPDIIRKPFFDCQKCIAGQAGFWLFPFWMTKKFGIIYDPVFHIFATVTPIFFAVLITILFEKLTGLRKIEPAKKSKYIPNELQNHDQGTKKNYLER